MANIIDYLDWRGDLTFSQSPFNAVDSLILCQLSYMAFDSILSKDQYHAQHPLSDTVTTLLIQTEQTDKLANTVMPQTPTDRSFLTALAKSKRFGPLLLTHYVNQIDYEAQKQFSALTILTGDDTVYLAFRGTDDSLIGWKENFNMSFLTPVPAQEESVRYLEEAALAYPQALRIGGHSKGGNLAVFAASFCQPHLQDWILDIYSHDAPGFDKKIIASKEYHQIRERIHSFVPQTSIIGMLLEHQEAYTVVRSTNSGLMQHDPYSWEIKGADFVRLESVDEDSKRIDTTIRSWINSIDYQQRERFVNGLYDVLTAANVKSAFDLTEDGLKAIRPILKSMSQLDEPTRKLINQTIYALFRYARLNLWKRDRPKKTH